MAEKGSLFRIFPFFRALPGHRPVRLSEKRRALARPVKPREGPAAFFIGPGGGAQPPKKVPLQSGQGAFPAGALAQEHSCRLRRRDARFRVAGRGRPAVPKPSRRAPLQNREVLCLR